MYNLEGSEYVSFTQGGGHGGSRPHFAREFVTALRDGRASFPDAIELAN